MAAASAITPHIAPHKHGCHEQRLGPVPHPFADKFHIGIYGEKSPFHNHCRANGALQKHVATVGVRRSDVAIGQFRDQVKLRINRLGQGNTFGAAVVMHHLMATFTSWRIGRIKMQAHGNIGAPGVDGYAFILDAAAVILAPEDAHLVPHLLQFLGDGWRVLRPERMLGQAVAAYCALVARGAMPDV